ncbi:WD40 repeat protein [Alteromonas sp. 76-1]|jgi:Tol biopolymer transport system component/imidazolonepropionase-like amidohydrolase|nr:WD40 repeat protein [Alteromonas sp. 76-1]
MKIRSRVLKLCSALLTASICTSYVSAKNNPPDYDYVSVHEGTALSVSLSPDASTLAIDLQGSLWTLPAEGGDAKRLTDVTHDVRQPVWSPDGTKIAYFAFIDGGYDLWIVNADGTNPKQLTRGAFDDREPVWSPDGSKLAFSSDRKNTYPSYDIWIIDVNSENITQVTDDKHENRMPVWTPDGKAISYTSQHDGIYGIWTASLNGDVKLEQQASTSLSPMLWTHDNKLLYVEETSTNGTAMKLDDKIITTDEVVFEFKSSLSKNNQFYYVSDGKIRRRSIDNIEQVDTIPLNAKLARLNPIYKHTTRDLTSKTEKPVLGVMRPSLSPKGNQIAFIALGNIYIKEIGKQATKLTDDHYMEADVSWSPDGKYLVYSSDKGGDMMQLWIHDMHSGKARQLTHLDTQPLGATWSPDGKSIAFINVDAMWGEASIDVVNVASGDITFATKRLKQPGKPSWSPDSSLLAVPMSLAYSKSFREGTNQIYMLPLDGSEPYWRVPIENMSIDTRGGAGPVWSPDGSKMAAVYGGELNVWPVSSDGKLLGPPRVMDSDIAHSPSWSGDSRTLLYQSNDKLKTVDIFSGKITDIPIELTYVPAIPSGTKVLHVSHLFDGDSPTLKKDVDILIKDNLIVEIAPHSKGLHLQYETIDGSGLYAMPGLIESHVHPQKDFGQGAHRGWLAYGITTIRDPGNQPYHGVEDREASEAGVRVGPRIYTTGHLMEWQRVYYKMGIAIAGPAHLEKELSRAKALKYDLLKSYVRLPDEQQKRVVEFAHNEMGVPVTTHEIFPAAKFGVDRVEHLGATSRRGYSPKHIGGRAYEDGLAMMNKVVTPTIFGSLNILLKKHPELIEDSRLALYPDWINKSLDKGTAIPARYLKSLSQQAVSLKQLFDQGTKITAGTDLVLALNLHGELSFYVNEAGLTPFQALQSATKVPAEELDLNSGVIAPGKIADIILLKANPLEDINNTTTVEKVIANGHAYTKEQLVDVTFSGKQ